MNTYASIFITLDSVVPSKKLGGNLLLPINNLCEGKFKAFLLRGWQVSHLFLKPSNSRGTVVIYDLTQMGSKYWTGLTAVVIAHRKDFKRWCACIWVADVFKSSRCESKEVVSSKRVLRNEDGKQKCLRREPFIVQNYRKRSYQKRKHNTHEDNNKGSIMRYNEFEFTFGGYCLMFFFMNLDRGSNKTDVLVCDCNVD